MARPDTEYQITPKGEELANRLASTRGVQNMMNNPIMSSMKPNSKRVSSQNSSSPEKIEKRVKKVPNKDPNFTTVAPGAPRPLKVNDSSADILGKMYNFMIKKATLEKKELKQEKKYSNKLVALKESRNKELINLFKVRKSKIVESPKKPKKDSKKINVVTKPLERMTAKGVSEEAGGIVSTVAKGVNKRAIVGGAVVGTVLAGSAASVIAKEEGLPAKGKAYFDPPSQRKLVSIGYGHQITENEYRQGFIQAGDEQIPIRGERGIDTVMTPPQAQKLLQQDLPKYEKRAADPLGSSWNKLNENQKTALTSYAYNTGSTKSLVNAGLKDAIDRGDMKEAANIIRDKGIKTANGQYNKVLDARRHSEAALFESDVKPEAKQTAVPDTSKTDAVTTIPEKMKKQTMGSKNTSVTVLNNNTNVINGSTTYSSAEETKEYSALLQKQYAYN